MNPVLTESMEELDSTVGGPMDVDDPLEKVLSRGNSTLIVVGCCVVVVLPVLFIRRSRDGGEDGGVSGEEPESVILILLRFFEDRRFHELLMLDIDMEPLMFIFCRCAASESCAFGYMYCNRSEMYPENLHSR